MLSKPLAFVVIVLACITAAAGGAYVATRHNLSDGTPAVRSARPEAPAALAAPAEGAARAIARPVAETEAVVSRKAEDETRDGAKAAVAEPAAKQPEAPKPPTGKLGADERASGAVMPQARKPETAKPAVTASAPVTDAPAPARQVQRTVPLPSAGAPATATEPPAAAPPLPAVAAPMPPKPFEPSRPAEDAVPEHAPQFEELVLPAAAVIGLQVETSVSSERARVEDRVDARVSRDVMASGRVAIPAGSRVIGSVATVERGGKLKDQARLGIRFHTLVLADGTEVALHTEPVYRFGEEPSAASSKKIGAAAIGGAVLGAILGGGKGAAIGGAAGAGAGSAAVMAGDRSAASLRPGEYLNVKLASPATITIEKRQE
jgi:type IV secretory pathway VirB10-like protein